MSYYFLEISLPSLKIGARPEISFEEFIYRLEVNLQPTDLKKVRKFRQLIDLFNIRALLSGQKLDNRGNFSEKELDQAMLVKDGFPQYVFDILGKWETNSAKLQNFPALLAAFFKEEIKKAKGFLKKYFAFERECRLVLAAFRATKMSRDLAEVLQFEELNDPFVAQILVQKDTGRYEPPVEYAELKEIFEENGLDAGLKHKMFTEWKFSRIEEMGLKPFSIDSILSYMVRLILVEDWQALDEEKGKEALKACAE
jgi:hypothetical protein